MFMSDFSSSWRVQVEVKDVWYAYATRPKSPALRGVSLRLEPGKLLALVGLSGSGKSTLVSLLERHYDPTQGQVRACFLCSYHTLDFAQHLVLTLAAAAMSTVGSSRS